MAAILSARDDQLSRTGCDAELSARWRANLPPPHRPAPREGQTNGHRQRGYYASGGGDLYLDELRFDSPERFITRARLGKLWKLW